MNLPWSKSMRWHNTTDTAFTMNSYVKNLFPAQFPIRPVHCTLMGQWNGAYPQDLKKKVKLDNNK